MDCIISYQELKMFIEELLQHLNEFAPFSQASDWDNVGLLVGDAKREVKRVLICLDLTFRSMQKALEIEANVILTHHPVIFHPIKNITDPFLLSLIEHQLNVISLHTNLDVAPQGTNYALAKVLGLEELELLSCVQGEKWFHLSVMVPLNYTENVADAVFQAGGGKVGNYVYCSTRHSVTGTFKPLAGAKPFISSKEGNKLNQVKEEELEFMVQESRLFDVISAIKKSHPYETPLMYYFPVATPQPLFGLGMVGILPNPLPLSEISIWIKDKLGCPQPKLWTAGLPLSTPIKKIAICGGNGSSLIKAAEQSAELYITGDIGYHSLMETKIPIVDAGHFYTEYPVLEILQQQLINWNLESFVLPQKECEYWQNMH
jgi:dinuclear metal center YbgI/SA1388 family protein